MSGRFYIRPLLAVAVAGLLTSCAGYKKESDPSMNVTGNVPPTLLSIDEKAEQIVGLVPTKDWPRIYAYVEEIQSTWVDYANATVASGTQLQHVPSEVTTLEGRVTAALSALRDAVTARDAPSTVRTATGLSEAAINLYEYNHPTIPPALHKVGVLERQILVDLSYDAYDSASTSLSNARQAWEQVEPTIQARAGDKAAAAIRDELDAQKSLVTVHDRDRLTASIQTTLALLDSLQRQF